MGQRLPPSRVTVRFDDDLGLELIEAVHHRPRFPRHAHPTYAVGAVVAGVNRFRCRGALHAAPAGTLCTVTAGEVHEVEPDGDGGFSYRCIYPASHLLRAAAEEVRGRRLGATPVLPPVIQDPEAARQVCALFDTRAEGAPRLEREARLLAVLARLVTRHASPAAWSATPPPASASPTRATSPATSSGSWASPPGATGDEPEPTRRGCSSCPPARYAGLPQLG